MNLLQITSSHTSSSPSATTNDRPTDQPTNNVFIHGSFNDNVRSWNYIVSDGRMINGHELQRIWKEVVTSRFMIQSQHSPGETEENHVKP